MDIKTVEMLIGHGKNLLFEYTPKIIGAIVVYLVGSYVIKIIMNQLVKILDNRSTEDSLKPFLKGIISAILKIILAISVLSMIGVEMTSFIAILGAAGLAVGLALSGTLQNFAGGIVILMFKPFKAGDFIDAQGYSGTVSEIQIFNTILKTPDNKTIIIPNGGLSTGAMTNYSSEPLRRVDWTVGIGYGDDLDQARSVLLKMCETDPRILKDPALFIGVSALADSSVNFAVRAWVKAEDYWGVFFDLNENIYKTFNKEGLHIPFPQMDVHVHNSK
jgi:small conductance mechanosensitive channel